MISYISSFFLDPKLHKKGSGGGETTVNKLWMLLGPPNRCQAMSALGGLPWSTLVGLGPQRAEPGGEGLSVACFPSWKRTASCKIEEGNMQSQWRNLNYILEEYDEL